MGKQFRFYGTSDDELVFFERLTRNLNCKIVLSWSSQSNDLVHVTDLEVISPGNAQDPLLLIPSSLDIKALSFDSYGPTNFQINQHKSPVAIWSRAFSSNGGSLPGRIWYQEKASEAAVAREAYNKEMADKFRQAQEEQRRKADELLQQQRNNQYNPAPYTKPYGESPFTTPLIPDPTNQGSGSAPWRSRFGQ